MLVEIVRAIIEKKPAYGVRHETVILRRELQKTANHKNVRRIMKVNKWQKKQHDIKQTVKGMRSQTFASNQRWAIDASSIFCGEDGWYPLAAVIDCCDRCIVGWRLSSAGVSKNAAAILEDAFHAKI